MEIRPLSTGSPSGPRPPAPSPREAGPPLDGFRPGVEAPAPSPLKALGGDPSASRRAAEALLVPGGARGEARETLLRDLSAFPAPVLKFLKDEGLRVALLAKGTSLADTGLLPKYDPAAYRSHLEALHGVFDRTVAEETPATEAELARIREAGEDPEFQLPMLRYWEGKRIRESLAPRVERLGVTVMGSTEPVDLDELAEMEGVPAEQRDHWKECLQVLNGGHAAISNGLAHLRHQVLLVPFTYYEGRPVPKGLLDSLKRVDDRHVQARLGLHIPESRLVALHEDYVTDPAAEVGHYRVALHEVGHALDHSLDRRPDLLPGHRAAVEGLYAADRKAFAEGGPNRFVSPRAMDDVREYFAEAVEAYLTVPVGDADDAYKPDAHHDRLRELNPQLFSYVEKVLRTFS